MRQNDQIVKLEGLPEKLRLGKIRKILMRFEEKERLRFDRNDSAVFDQMYINEIQAIFKPQ